MEDIPQARVRTQDIDHPTHPIPCKYLNARMHTCMHVLVYTEALSLSLSLTLSLSLSLATHTHMPCISRERCLSDYEHANLRAVCMCARARVRVHTHAWAQEIERARTHPPTHPHKHTARWKDPNRSLAQQPGCGGTQKARMRHFRLLLSSLPLPSHYRHASLGLQPGPTASSPQS